MEKHRCCALDRVKQLAVVLLAVFIFDAEADAVCGKKEREIRLFDLGKIVSVFAAGFLERVQELGADANGAEIAKQPESQDCYRNQREKDQENQELTCRKDQNRKQDRSAHHSEELVEDRPQK